MRFYPFVFTSTDEGGIAAYYYAGTDLCASREQSQACLSYAETKQSVRSNRVAERLGSGGLSYDATCVTDNGEVAKRSDGLFWEGLKALNEHKAKPEDFKEMSLVDAKGKEVDWLNKIDLDKLVMSWQLEAKIDPWKIHAVIDDNSYPAMPGNIRYENEPDVFFYHSDHLGGASWITDANGKPVQHLQYLPFGEPFVNQHPAGYQERFTFTGKERDEETGYGYFGARYMDYSLMTMWLSVDPMADKYPAISPYAYCAWNPVKLVDPDGMAWKDTNGTVITDHSKIKVYIFYDPKEFKEQSLQMYNEAIEKYGPGSAALSDVTTEDEFAQDWHDMAGNDIREVDLNYHGTNQAIHLDYRNEEYITSTGDGKTNRSGLSGLDIKQLPSIKGNIKNAQLNINSCHSNKRDEHLRGSMQTLMEAFYNCFGFRYVRGTRHGVSYDRLTGHPRPGHNGRNFHLTWEFLPEVKVNTNFTEYIGTRR